MASGTQGPAPPLIFTPRGTLNCNECTRAKPERDFRKVKSPSGRATICRQCESKLLQAERMEERVAKVAEHLMRMRGRSAEQERQQLHITEFVNRTMMHAGGVDGFVGMWWDQIQYAMIQDPGSPRVLNAFQSIAKMVVDATEHVGSAPDPSEMSEAELADELRAAIEHDPQVKALLAPEDVIEALADASDEEDEDDEDGQTGTDIPGGEDGPG